MATSDARRRTPGRAALACAAGREIALHAECRGLRHQRVVDPAHFEGVAGFRTPVRREVLGSEPIAPALLRPLVEYEQLAGGSF